MKIARMLAAASLVVASLGVTTAASAQSYNGGADRAQSRDHRGDGDRRDVRGDRNDRHDRTDRRDDRRDDRGRHYGSDRGRHYGWDRNHRRCHVEWRHHRKVRICR